MAHRSSFVLVPDGSDFTVEVTTHRGREMWTWGSGYVYSASNAAALGKRVVKASQDYRGSSGPNAWRDALNAVESRFKGGR